MSASATLAPARRRDVAASPHLQVVRSAPEEGARRRPRPRITKVHVACTSVGGLLALLFVLAVMQTALAQGQARLDDLKAQTTDAQADAQQLRLTVAELESPARIVAEAQSRLGMVEPEAISFVPPVDPSEPVVGPPAPPPDPSTPPAPEAP